MGEAYDFLQWYRKTTGKDETLCYYFTFYFPDVNPRGYTTLYRVRDSLTSYTYRDGEWMEAVLKTPIKWMEVPVHAYSLECDK